MRKILQAANKIDVTKHSKHIDWWKLPDTNVKTLDAYIIFEIGKKAYTEEQWSSGPNTLSVNPDSLTNEYLHRYILDGQEIPRGFHFILHRNLSELKGRTIRKILKYATSTDKGDFSEAHDDFKRAKIAIYEENKRKRKKT